MNEDRKAELLARLKAGREAARARKLGINPPMDDEASIPPPESVTAREALGDDAPNTPREAGESAGGSATTPKPPRGEPRQARASVRKPSGKRGRGRPRKDAADTDEPRASKSKAQATTAGYAQALVIIHAGLAAVLKSPEMNLAANEATMYASALDGFAQEFGVVLSSKAQAAMTLIGVAGMIYVPRIAAISARKKAAKRPPQPAQQDAPIDLAAVADVAGNSAINVPGYKMNFGGVN